MRWIPGWHHIESLLSIDLFEDGVNFTAVGQVNGANSIVLHFHRPLVADRNEHQQINVFQRLSDPRHHPFDKGIVDIGCGVVRGVLRIGDVVHRRAIENHAVVACPIGIHAAGVVIHLNAVVQAIAFLAELNVISLRMKRSEGFLFADVVRVTFHPIPNHGAFALGMGSTDGDSHGTQHSFFVLALPVACERLMHAFNRR